MAAGVAAPASAAQPAGPDSHFRAGHRKLVLRADLVCDKPASRGEEGIPVGNGRMGSLVRTTPAPLRVQIDRVDVYANHSYTNSFFERHGDYRGGCGFMNAVLASFDDDPFPASGFAQRLSVHGGQLTIDGKGVSARILAWPAQDVPAVAVDDRRPRPEPVDMSLRMLRCASQYFGRQREEFARNHVVTVRPRSHTAALQLIVRGKRIVLVQEFREGEFRSKSAVAIAKVGGGAGHDRRQACSRCRQGPCASSLKGLVWFPGAVL